ncbi:hypothetical protein GJ699_10070 [Duganella sp. FT80W]|uniref:DUF1640 domain-containing protein n=1 Tax=Duganella guangzhouensis TaxID=2666084 RepID=A0A6I2KX26_9BURK|nr:hypothetical protein [Duganella guangzhouensis]MRW90331.1 hypothetical protein [Duganella guangzhouensis]
MTMPIFDTLSYVNKLTGAGMPREQAEAQAQALFEILAEGTVTPGAIAILKADLLARMDELRTELIGRIESVRTEFIGRIESVRTEFIERIESVRTELIGKIDAVETGLNAKIDALRFDLEVFKARTNAKFTILFVLSAVQIGLLVYVVSRLP